jgi:hypothetical protein
MNRRIELGRAPTDLSSDGSVRLEPPCTVVVQAGDSSVALLEAGDLCNGGDIEVLEGDRIICLVGSEGSGVVVAEPDRGRVAVVGILDRLDMSDGYDPGGLHRVVIHELPGSADVLIEYEFGIARVDVAERELAWQQVHGDLTNRVTRLSADHVRLEGENTQFGHRLSDGAFVLQPGERAGQRER